VKRFLPAFVLALTIHGFFMGTAQKWLKKKIVSSPVPRVITMTLTYQRPQSPLKPVKDLARHHIPAAKPVPVVRTEKLKPVVKPSVTMKKVSAPIKPVKKKKPPIKPEKRNISKAVPRLDPVRMPDPKPAARPEKLVQEPPDYLPGLVEEKETDAEQVIRNDFKAPLEKSTEQEGIIPVEETYRDLAESEKEMVEMAAPDDAEKETPGPPAQVSRAEMDQRMRSDMVAVTRARPVYRANSPPEYPGLARRRGYEGTVILEVLVDSTGRVGELRLSKSSNHGVLDRAAMATVKKWLFEPGTKGGVPVEMWVKVPIRFSLK